MKKLVSLSIVLALAGCATQPPVQPKPATPDPVLQSLSHAAQQVAQAQADLARITAAQHPKMVPTQPPQGVQLPPELEQKTLFYWDGPLEQAVNALAASMGYQVKTVGVSPGAPVLVNLHQQASVYQLIQDMGLQAGNAAGVLIDPQQKTLTIVWGAPEQRTETERLGAAW